MEKICATCAKDPSSHSFKRVSEKNGVTIFYTKPISATKYEDTAGTILHIDRALHAIGNKKWTWIFDGDGFDAKYALEINTGWEILQLIQDKYDTQLQQILFINPTWHVKWAIKAGSICVNDSVKSKVKIMDDRVYSILEFM
jgi:hypothetical protein